jgi:hypothetical protein
MIRDYDPRNYSAAQLDDPRLRQRTAVRSEELES